MEKLQNQLMILAKTLDARALEKFQDEVNYAMINQVDLNKYFDDLSKKIYQIAINRNLDILNDDQLNTLAMLVYLGMDYTQSHFENLAVCMLAILEKIDSNYTKSFAEELATKVKKNLYQERQEIDNIDHQIMELLNYRMGLMKKVAIKKKMMEKPIMDNAREAQIIEQIEKFDYSDELKEIYNKIMGVSKKLQER